MDRIDIDSVSTIDFKLKYADNHAQHTQIFQAQRVNLWKDIFPASVADALMQKSAGEKVTLSIQPDELVGQYKPANRFEIDPAKFNHQTASGYSVQPRYGRFYPKGLLRDIAGVYPQNVEPFRCIASKDNRIGIEFNHPLASKPVELSATIGHVSNDIAKQGGACMNWLADMAEGPGMQSRCNGKSTDFFSDAPFSKVDVQPDTEFYRQPRLVNHIDSQAIQNITNIYARHLKPGMRVLDLMSSWVSHLPRGLELDMLVGLGMNAVELDANDRLTQRVVHDLNRDPSLPFDTGQFDAVICTVSLEYLTKPFKVFHEVARALQENGRFLVTFSNRWFPPKVIKRWTELLPFERMGMVLEYFMDSGEFANLETLTLRGYPRPVTDKYFPNMLLSDPVYAVIGQKRRHIG